MKEFFEIGMLLCFGFSWPAAIYKTWKVKNPAGKSLVFEWLIITGYICGILSNLLKNNFTINRVLFFYVIDLLLVSTDLVLVYRYRYFNGHKDQ